MERKHSCLSNTNQVLTPSIDCYQHTHPITVQTNQARHLYFFIYHLLNVALLECEVTVCTVVMKTDTSLTVTAPSIFRLVSEVILNMEAVLLYSG